ncbi:CobW-like GTP-binding protein [Pelosinus baikalensis]|uniref:CobW-like GTP-binding protein n=1 Tax=Pelosinus baikalensis TaxID=2892015 RepID=A0ABS8HYK9_9FIRM|nr:CobW-like GTP-binding protein [Pelosinus baikalensis]MCC5468277.1 CobW-like GTP-binding protein [Pelosinus baikalensis]
MLKVVDIVQGFLGSGKTSLINHLIQHVFEDEMILVILTEWGKTQVIEIGSRVITYSWDCSFMS